MRSVWLDESTEKCRRMRGARRGTRCKGEYEREVLYPVSEVEGRTEGRDRVLRVNVLGNETRVCMLTGNQPQRERSDPLEEGVPGTEIETRHSDEPQTMCQTRFYYKQLT